MTTRRLAANPIPYWSRSGKTREVFEEAFRDFQQIGFTAAKADVPGSTSRWRPAYPKRCAAR